MSKEQIIGEPFNPWHEACGFWPADAVARDRDLTDGQKRLYERLVRFAGKDGVCFPSQARLAAELGKSDRQIRKDLRKLEQFGLIKHAWRNSRRANTYTFTWHAMLERNQSSAQNPARKCADPALKCADGAPKCAMADLNGTAVPVNGTGLQDLSGTLGGLSGTIGPFERNWSSDYIVNKSKKSSSTRSDEVSHSWSRDEVRYAQDSLQRSWGGRHDPPDEQITGRILACFRTLDEFRKWLCDLSLRVPAERIKGWGFYLTDADAQRFVPKTR